jgi:hypothetical protein
MADLENIVTRLGQTRRMFREIMNELPTPIFWGEYHQSNTAKVLQGAVIMFAHHEHVNEIDGRTRELSWAPALRGLTVTSERLAIVEKNTGEGGLLLRVLTEFDDDTLSSTRKETFLDPLTSNLRPRLENFLQVVALDSIGPIVPEPQCFNKGA